MRYHFPVFMYDPSLQSVVLAKLAKWNRLTESDLDAMLRPEDRLRLREEERVPLARRLGRRQPLNGGCLRPGRILHGHRLGVRRDLDAQRTSEERHFVTEGELRFGAGLNPARAFGPELVSAFGGGVTHWAQLIPVYVLPGLAGAGLAAFAYDVLAEPRRVTRPIKEAVTTPDPGVTTAAVK